jgi:hypothetical protein
MDLRDFFSDALSGPADLVAYEVSRKLTQLYPDRAVIEGSFYSFDLRGFIDSAECLAVKDTSVYNKSRMEFSESGKSLIEEPENAWFNVLWREHVLDVLLLTFHQEGYRDRHHWIIAESEATAKEFLTAVCDWGSQVRGEILVFDRGYWHKNEDLFNAIRTASFDNLVLPMELIGELRTDVSRFFASRELYEQYRIPWKRGILLTGPPGNGKTHTIKALINETKLPCLYVKSLKGCWGSDHERIRQIFGQARKTAPCVLVLEDLDSLIDDSNRSFFLNEMDGFAENTGVLVVATTNHPEKLDVAIVDRPGRFDRKYHFPLPAADSRHAYLRKWSESLQSELRVTDEALLKTVERTHDFSFAYLKELCVTATMGWMSDDLKLMDKVLCETATLLRDQMTDESRKKKKKNKRKKKKRKEGH